MLRELERATGELELKGILLYSNLAVRFSYEADFQQLFAATERHGLPVVLHPAAPVTWSVTKGYDMSTMLRAHVRHDHRTVPAHSVGHAGEPRNFRAIEAGTANEAVVPSRSKNQLHSELHDAGGRGIRDRSESSPVADIRIWVI